MAPPPTAVVSAAGIVVTGEAKVIPPPPRILVQSPGVIAVPGRRSATGSFTRRAAASTDLIVNSNYGYRRGRRHNGIDYDGDRGDTVGASMAGTVAFAGVKRGYGNLIILDHGKGISTYYAHLSAMYVTEGQPVDAAQIIGTVGSTGRSSGPHLHYEVRVHGKPVHPSTLLTISGDQVLVNGEVIGAESESTSNAATPNRAASPDPNATGTRPRRVSQVDPNTIQKRTLFYGKDSMTGF